MSISTAVGICVSALNKGVGYLYCIGYFNVIHCQKRGIFLYFHLGVYVGQGETHYLNFTFTTMDPCTIALNALDIHGLCYPLFHQCKNDKFIITCTQCLKQCFIAWLPEGVFQQMRYLIALFPQK